MENQGRLVAMGVDAFRLLPWLYAGDMPEALRGATGLLSLGSDGVITRELDWAEFRGGRPEPLLPGDFSLGGKY
jgi:outer membrane PBP1 activator LpoA protein